MARRPPGSRLFMNPAPYEEADSAWRAARRSSPSWRAPERVLSVFPSDQLADIFRYRWPSWLAAPDLPGSKTEGSLFGARRSASQSKPLTVRPRRTGRTRQLRSLLRRALQDADLVTESEDLKLKCQAGSQYTPGGPEHCRQHSRGWTLDGRCASPTLSVRSGFARTTIRCRASCMKSLSIGSYSVLIFSQ